MNPEQLSDEIEGVCSHYIDASVYHNRGQGITISLDGEFTPEDLVKIVKLLEEEGYCEREI